MPQIENRSLKKTNLIKLTIATVAVILLTYFLTFFLLLSGLHLIVFKPYMLILIIIFVGFVLSLIWKRYLQVGILWTGRVMSIIATALTIFATVSLSIDNISGIDISIWITIFAIAVLLSALFLVWWKRLTGGLVLLLISIAIWPFLQIFDYNFNAWLIFGCPYAIAGILLLTSGILSRDKNNVI